MSKVDWATSSDPHLVTLLRRHPGVLAAELGDDLLAFGQGASNRKIFQGPPATQLAGLVELIDNNPMVCADAFTLPDPLSLLALIALGPPILAGILRSTPTVLSSFTVADLYIEAYLAGLGWGEGAIVSVDSQDLGTALAITAVCEIATSESDEELDDMFDERFGRSFYVHAANDGAWDVARVIGTAQALYRLRLTPGEESSLLTILVMADGEGKTGAGGLIHAMNVMAGFEESLGVP